MTKKRTIMTKMPEMITSRDAMTPPNEEKISPMLKKVLVYSA
jgi:hypothetical protein